MPLLSSSSSFDEIVERATLETQTNENWGIIIEICDRVQQGGKAAAKECLLSLKKRLNHRDPHVILLAFSVLDSCMSNCGKPFQLEVCTREFVAELKSKATGSNAKIAERARQLVKKWADEECKSDTSLSLIPSLYGELRRDGIEFSASSSSSPPSVDLAARRAALSSGKVPTDPNVVLSQQEADDIAKAIQLSLQQSAAAGQQRGSTTKLSSMTAQSSLYPAALGASSSAPSMGAFVPPPIHRVVKALYDFEAAEDNELTFKAGEMITVTDDSDINWWKGANFRGEGLFPASFVTADLTAVTEQPMTGESKKKSVQFDDKVSVKTVPAGDGGASTSAGAVEETAVTVVPVIDEQRLNHCLEMLQNVDPTGERADPPQLPRLEEECHAMGPLVDAELEAVDSQYTCLADVNARLMDALNLYHAAMKDASAALLVQQQFQAQQQFAMGANVPGTGSMQQQALWSAAPPPAGTQATPYMTAPSGNFTPQQQPQQASYAYYVPQGAPDFQQQQQQYSSMPAMPQQPQQMPQQFQSGASQYASFVPSAQQAQPQYGQYQQQQPPPPQQQQALSTNVYLPPPQQSFAQ